MFKILHQIASNVHSPAACKIYTKLQNPPVSCYSRRAQNWWDFSWTLVSSCARTPLQLPSAKATPRFIISWIINSHKSLFVTLFCHPWSQLLTSLVSSRLYCLFSLFLFKRFLFSSRCFSFSLSLIGFSVRWCERRSSEQVPVLCSCWSSDGPRWAAAEPGRRSPAPGKPPLRHCSLKQQRGEFKNTDGVWLSKWFCSVTQKVAMALTLVMYNNLNSWLLIKTPPNSCKV